MLVQHQTSLFRAHAGPCAFGGAAVCSLSARPSATPGSVLGMAMQERRGGRGEGRGGRASFRGAGGGRGRGTAAGRGRGPSWGEEEELGKSSARPDFARMRKDSNRETV